jgi:hypothetical protein
MGGSRIRFEPASMYFRHSPRSKAQLAEMVESGASLLFSIPGLYGSGNVAMLQYFATVMTRATYFEPDSRHVLCSLARRSGDTTLHCIGRVV